MAVPAHAQFGGITFDPTQSAHAIVQISNEAKALTLQAQQIAAGSQTNLTLIQQLSQDVQIAATRTENLQPIRDDLQHHFQQPEVFQREADLEDSRKSTHTNERREQVR